jgi:hypothetical protein
MEMIGAKGETREVWGGKCNQPYLGTYSFTVDPASLFFGVGKGSSLIGAFYISVKAEEGTFGISLSRIE